ncbi:unnamed protein product [Aureobasidium pullulans]|uniref:NADH dehydrogenase [ubiquinone] 1 beta subcomplex subunit 4 n=1 Tax=Aureobasidium pullulans TaxID=5580 RepID=A0A4S8X0S4_AURPU|nr:hypothetical protein D6D22_09515 [Aureobasidium pullulans]THX66983.1 hypothetical protein D6D08_06905 [Aureobasidium pullulans]CAC9891735.1 unnamed protein product [Aureobasidium pullulans]
MAGGSHNSLAFDPALVKYNQMSVDRYKHFKWTPRTAWLSIIFAVAIPSSLYYVANKTDGKYEFRGKRRGDTMKEF